MNKEGGIKLELIFVISMFVFFFLNVIFLGTPLFFVNWFEGKMNRALLILLCVILPFVTFGSSLYLLSNVVENLNQKNEIHFVTISLGMLAIWNGIPLLIGFIIKNRSLDRKMVVHNE